jgi:hypothetical protein
VWFAGLSYLAAMALLAQLWEIIGGIVFFLFIQSAADLQLRRLSRLFLIYVLYEGVAIVSMITGWEWLFLPQSIPLTMLALLVLYALLLVAAYRVFAGIRGNAA